MKKRKPEPDKVMMAGNWRSSMDDDEFESMVNFLENDAPPAYGMVRRLVEMLDGYEAVYLAGLE